MVLFCSYNKYTVIRRSYAQQKLTIEEPKIFRLLFMLSELQVITLNRIYKGIRRELGIPLSLIFGRNRREQQ